MKYTLAAAAASVLVAFAVPASAATIVQSAPIAPTSTASNVVFNQFNSSLGTLVSVSVLFDSTFSATGVLQNTLTTPPTKNFTVSSFGSANLAGNGINIDEFLFNGASAFSIAANSSQGVNLVSGASSSDTQVLVSGLAPFIGAGTTFLTFTPTSSFSVSPSGANLTSSPVFGGNVQLTYEYTAAAVPEPASWALMIAGFGIVGGSMRRRRATMGTLQRV